MAGVELATAYVALQADGTGFGRSVSKEVGRSEGAADTAGKRFGGRFSSAFGNALKIGGALAAGFAAVKIKDFIGGAISEASDLGESINAVNVTFGKAAGGIKQLGEEAARSLGLSNTEFNSLAVRFSSFAQTVAGPGGDVVGVMDELTTRAADFASVMNLDVADAAEKFQSGLAGETEPLRQFGLDLSAAAVEAFAYKNGIAEAGAELSEQQKVQARYGLLMKQTAKTQGDFANTSDSLANSQRILGAEWANLQADLGQALIPLLAKGTTFLANFVSGMREGTGVGGQVAAAFGKLKDAIIPVVEFFKENPKLAKALAVGLGVVAGAIAAVTLATTLFSIALNTTGIPLIIIAIAALAAGIYALYQRSETFRRIVNQIGSGLRSFAGFVRKQVIPVVVDMAKKVAKNLAPVWRALAKFFQKSVLPAVEKLVKAFRKAQPTLQKVAKFVLKTQASLLKFYSAVAGKVLPIVIRLAGFLLRNTVRAISFAIRAIGKIVGAVKGFGRALGNGLAAVGRFIGGIRDRIGRAVTIFRNLPGRVVRSLGRIGTKLYSAGKNLILGMVNGVKDYAGQLVDAVGDAIGDAIDWGKKKLGISSPSKVFAEIGRDTMRGFALGIEKNEGEATNAVGRAMDDVARVGASTLQGSVPVSSAASGGGGMDLDAWAAAVVRAFAAASLSVNVDGRTAGKMTLAGQNAIEKLA